MKSENHEGFLRDREFGRQTFGVCRHESEWREVLGMPNQYDRRVPVLATLRQPGPYQLAAHTLALMNRPHRHGRQASKTDGSRWIDGDRREENMADHAIVHGRHKRDTAGRSSQRVHKPSL